MSDFRNQFTFHAGANQTCNVPKQAPLIGGDRIFTAEVLNTNCTGETGCSFYDPSGKFFGRSLNDAGGGVFALLRNRSGFKIWFFERQSIPIDISSGDPDPYSWPPPHALLSADDCNIDSSFSPQTIILDTAICGDQASSDYPNSGCNGSCTQQVTDGQNYVGEYFMCFLLIVLYRCEPRCPMGYQLHRCVQLTASVPSTRGKQAIKRVTGHYK